MKETLTDFYNNKEDECELDLWDSICVSGACIGCVILVAILFLMKGG